MATLSPKFKSVLAGLAFVIVLVILLVIRNAPLIQRSLFYPTPKTLPPIVSESTGELLGRLEAVLREKAPATAQALQPGLSLEEIATLEAQGGFQLSEDLRTFYHWHNGIATNSVIELIPGHLFNSLEHLVAERIALRQQQGAATPGQHVAVSFFAGHRKSWLQILDDRAGDGYFYDPERSADQGAFFYHLAEDGYYQWFPSLGNFLAGVIECYERGAFKVVPGSGLDEDFDMTFEIWERFGTSSQ